MSRKKITEEEEIEETEEEEQEGEIAEGIEGLPDDVVSYALWRLTPDKKSEFVGDITPPFSVSDIQRDYGAGVYDIYGRTLGGKKISVKKRVRIAGIVKAGETVRTAGTSPVNSISEFVELYETVNKINADKKKGALEDLNMSGVLMQTMAGMMNMMSESMRGMMQLQKEVKEESSEKKADWPEVIREVVGVLGESVQSYLVAKSPALQKVYAEKNKLLPEGGEVTNPIQLIKARSVLMNFLSGKLEGHTAVDLLYKLIPDYIRAYEGSTDEMVIADLAGLGIKADREKIVELLTDIREYSGE